MAGLRLRSATDLIAVVERSRNDRIINLKTQKVMKKKTANRPQIEEQAHAKRLGRLSQATAKAIRRESADIYITENYVKHIFNKHVEQLKAVGYTPFDFVKEVVKGFNRIYQGSGNSILLVKWNGAAKVAAIELNFAFQKEFYEVKTAQIRAKGNFKDEKLLWKKK